MSRSDKHRIGWVAAACLVIGALLFMWPRTDDSSGLPLRVVGVAAPGVRDDDLFGRRLEAIQPDPVLFKGHAHWGGTGRPATGLQAEAYTGSGQLVAFDLVGEDGTFVLPVVPRETDGVRPDSIQIIVRGRGGLSEACPGDPSELMEIQVTGLYGMLLEITDEAGEPPTVDPRLWFQTGSFSARAESPVLRPIRLMHKQSLELAGGTRPYLEREDRWKHHCLFTGPPGVEYPGKVSLVYRVPGYPTFDSRLDLAPFEFDGLPVQVRLAGTGVEWAPLEIHFRGDIALDGVDHDSRMPCAILILASLSPKREPYKVRIDTISEALRLRGVPVGDYEMWLEAAHWLGQEIRPREQALHVGPGGGTGVIGLEEYGTVAFVLSSEAHHRIRLIRMQLGSSVLRTDSAPDNRHLTLEPVPRGTYSVETRGEDHEWHREPTSVVVRPGEVVVVNL